MLKCKNNPKKKYSGNEPSPKGLGYCASAEELGKKRKGRDGNFWVVKKNSAGIQRWVKYKLVPTTRVSGIANKNTSPSTSKYWSENFLDGITQKQKKLIQKLVTDVKKEVESKNIRFFVVIHHPYNGMYIIDDVWERIRKKGKNNYDYLDKPFVVMVVREKNRRINLQNTDNCLMFQHNLIKKKDRETIYDIFTKHIRNRVIWNKSNLRAICVNMK